MKDSVYKIRDNLVNHIEVLEGYTKNMGAELISSNLKQMRLRYSHGLVRIIFMGGTNAGKSTTINAVLKKIVVPENPNTASPVPVWIGYTPKEEKIEVVLKKEVNSNDVEFISYDPLSFRKEFCYNHKEQSDVGRQRFERVRWASVMTDSEILKDGITLIDSLGTKANDFDSIKTLEILNDGVDAVFYLINSTNGLQKEDVEFIRDYLLGYGDRAVMNPLNPKHFVLVVNCFNDTPIGVTLQGLSDKLKEIFKKSDGAFDLEGYHTVANNIIAVNSRNSRLDSCGAFPYVENAPNGSDERYLRNAKILEDMEKAKAEKLDDNSRKEANLEELRIKVKEMAAKLCYGQDSCVSKRLNELIDICNLIIRVAERRKEKSDEKLNQVKEIMRKVVEIKGFFDLERKRLNRDLEGFENNLIDSINTIMNGTKVNDYNGYITGFVREFTSIPSELPQYSKYKQSLNDGNAACFELIRGAIEPIITQCLLKTGRKIVDNLWDYQLNTGIYRAPKQLIEDVRKYLFHQRTILSGKMEELRKGNIENVGIILPDESAVRKYSENLVSIAETSILYSFSTYTDISKWNEVCKGYLKKVKVGFLSWIFSGFNTMSQERFWQELKNKVITPTVLAIFNEAFLRGTVYYCNDRPIRNAFTEIMRSFGVLFDRSILQIEQETVKIQTDMEATDSEHDFVKAEMQKLIDHTEALKKDIIESRDELVEVA